MSTAPQSTQFLSERLSKLDKRRGVKILSALPKKDLNFVLYKWLSAIRIAPDLKTEVHQLHNNPHTITPRRRSRGRPDNQP
jgi:ubiquinone biosynthesis protein Coq4